jgi:hypothetical protein
VNAAGLGLGNGIAGDGTGTAATIVTDVVNANNPENLRDSSPG